MYHFQRSLDLFNLIECHKRLTDSSMQADQSIFDNRGKRQPIENVVDFIED